MAQVRPDARRLPVPLAVVTALLTAAVTACGSSGSSGPGDADASPSPMRTSLHQVLGDPCDAPEGGTVVGWSAGGDDLTAVTYPPTSATATAGHTAVVVNNQSGSTLCNWLPAIDTLRAFGTVWLHDTPDESEVVDNVKATVAEALSHGATTVLLVGASMGAKASLVVAAGLPPDQVTGVVALSPEAELEDGTSVGKAIQDASFPTFLATATDDPYDAAPACRSFQRARPDVTTLVTVPGAQHGTALLGPPDAAKVVPAIQAFVTGLQS